MVDCTLDEVVGVALALNRPIAIPEDLFEGTVVRILISTSLHDSVKRLDIPRPVLTRQQAKDKLAMRCITPGLPAATYVQVQTRSTGRKGGIIQLEAEVDKENAKRVRDLMAKMDAVKPAWEIKTATEFW